MPGNASLPNLRPGRFSRFCRWLIQYEWLFLLVLLPFVLFPSPARSPALLLIPLLWLVRKIGWGHFVPLTALDWSIWGLLLMVLISLYATFDMSFSFGKIAGVVYGTAVYYATAAFVRNDRARLWWGVLFLLVLGLGVVVLGLLGTQWTQKFPLLQGVVGLFPERLFSLPGTQEGFSPNQVAGGLLLVAPLSLTLAGTGVVRVKGLWGVLRPYQVIFSLIGITGTAFMMSGTLLLTQSRGGLFGFGVSCLFILIVVVARWKGRWGLGLTLLLTVSGIGAVAAAAGVEQTVNLLFEQTGLEPGGEQINSLSGRVEIWSRAFYAIQDFPFTGVGMNNFRRIVPILYPLFLIAPDVDIAHAHNHLLQAALDLGLPGLVAYLSLWLLTAVMLWQSWKRADSVWLRGLALGFAGSLLAHFVYGMIDVVALGAKPGFIFWVSLGLITALHGIVTAVNSNEEMTGTPIDHV